MNYQLIHLEFYLGNCPVADCRKYFADNIFRSVVLVVTMVSKAASAKYFTMRNHRGGGVCINSLPGIGSGQKGSVRRGSVKD